MFKQVRNWVAFCLLAVPMMQAQSSAADDLSGAAIASTLIYGLIGLVLFMAGYVLFDKVLKLDLRKELAVDQNTSIGVMMAGVFIGIGIIIAAAMK